MPAFGAVDWGKALTWLRGRTGAELAAEQEQAVRLALTQRVAVLTGGPGCGKSFTVKSVITLAAAKRAKIVLAAPTGRAAKRLTELSGHPATTVHRLLQLRPGGDPSFDRDHPLDADLIVVDEASMLDLILANKLIKAVPPGAHLLLVGDVDQLPSVGAGEVLRDVLRRRHHPPGPAHHDLPAGPAVRGGGQRAPDQRRPAPGVRGAPRLLPVPRRRAGGHRGAGGRPGRPTGSPASSASPRGTSRCWRRCTAARPAPAPSTPCCSRPSRPRREGTPERRHGARVFRPGDKVIQIRNNYDKGAAGVFNGTVGTITALSVTDQQLTVRTDEDEDIVYDFDELDELQHAYAITVHRSQGSEYPAVVVPLTMSAYTLLQRNLLYTAITRAKRLVVLVGSRKALAIAVRTAGTGRRHTALTHRLQKPGNTAG